MKETQDEIMQTTPVRIDNDVLSMVRSHKSVTGIPMQRFIEEAIVEKISNTSDDIKKKMGLTPRKLNKVKKK
jgi:hypothetical protein